MWLNRWGWLIVAVMCLRLTLLRVRLVPTRLRKLLPDTDGLHRYRLEDQTLCIQNAAGDHKIPLSEMKRFRSSPAGIIVEYAGTSTFTLPDGPVCRELERRLKRPRSTAPDDTP